MRLQRFRLAGLLVAFSPLFACGGAAPQPATPAKAPVLAPIAPKAPVAVDLSPVRRPDGVLLTAHLAKPDRSLKVLGELIGSVVPRAVGLSAEQFASALLGPSLTDVVDFTQPFDVAMMAGDFGSSQAFAVSAALTSVDDWEESKKDGATHFGGGLLGGHCEVRTAAGPAPNRLVCATDGRTLATLAPYLTRTVARIDGGADAHVEIAIAPVLPLLGANTHDPKEDADKSSSRLAGEEMGRALSQEMLSDFDTVAVDLSLERSVAEVTLTARFKPNVSSAIARVFVAQSKDARPIPETFWRLPGDAGSAAYVHGVERADFDGVRAFLKTTVFDDVERDGVPPAIVARGRAAFESLFFTGGPLVVAHGFDPEAAKKAVALATPKSLRDKQAEARALSGWTVLGVEEPTTKWISGVRELIAVDKVKYARKRPDTDKSETNTAFNERAVRSDEKLPPGSFHLVLETTPKPRAKGADASKPLPLASTAHVYFAPDGAARTWIAIAETEALAIAKLHGVLDTTAPATTLARRAGISGMKDLKTNVAAFLTVDDIGRMAVSSNGTEKDHTEARTRLELLGSLAGHGTTPVVMYVEGDHPEANSVALKVSIPRPAITDIISVGLASH